MSNSERKAIVDWLRGISSSAHKIFSDSDSEFFQGKSEAYADAAQSIERGEHLKKGQEMTTSKYDDAKVEALLKAAQAVTPFVEGHVSEKADKLIAAIEALMPSVEMEYVLPEWREFQVGRCVGSNGLVYIDGLGISMPHYDALREATRRPKRDLVPPGKDWTDAEIFMLPESVTIGGTFYPQNIRAVIDAIKAKCGV